ncbi:hypothetical protein CRYUN_Cryun11dG0053700 [Craigia yunnanensis]
MVCIATGACSSSLLFRNREAGGNGASQAKYNGLRVVENIDINNFYNKLLEGESGITQIDMFDASNYFVQFTSQIRDFSSKEFIDGNMITVLMIAGGIA